MSDLELENAAMAPRRWNELFIAIRETASQMPVTLMQCCFFEQLELSMIRFLPRSTNFPVLNFS